MKFAENRPVKIVMLGAGGTGGHIPQCNNLIQNPTNEVPKIDIK